VPARDHVGTEPQDGASVPRHVTSEHERSSLAADAIPARGPRFFVRAWLSGPRADLVVACALWALAFCIGSSYMRTFDRSGGVADFGQPEFGAAVALACGRGFVNPGYTEPPGLARFLARQSDVFSCDELPATVGSFELNFTQRLYRYLMSAVALVWALRGVSWSGLWPLFGALFGFAIASAYGLFRLGIGRPLAVAASLALVVSAIHLGHLPYLRDYAKAPFMLALLLVMARMPLGPAAPRRLMAYGMAFGVILGVGFGFRNDLLINVPPFLAVVWLCLPGRVFANLRVKAAATAAAAVGFVAVAWPILRAYNAGSNTGHVAVLGLMTPFDRLLGIRGSLYDWGYAYVDQFAANVITSYSYRVDGRYVEYLSKAYDREAVAYLLQIVRHWPADILSRVYGSVLSVLELPFTVGTYTLSIPYGATSAWVAALYGWQIWLLLGYLSGCGLILTTLALMLISARSAWTAAALLLFLLYYAGYPVIQFGARHFFHLEFIGWWTLAFVVQQALALAWWSARGTTEALRAAVRPRTWARPLARVAIFALVATSIVAGSLTTLRAYQTPHVRSLLRDYLAAPREPLETTSTMDGEKVLIASPELWAPSGDETLLMPVRARYLVAEFSSTTTCDAVQLPVKFRYWYQTKTSDFSRDMVLKLMPHGEPTRVFFPAYYNRSWSSSEGPSGSYFEGVELPRGYAGCITALSRITDLERYPILLDITFTPAWEQATPFQTLAAIERSTTADGAAFYTVPRDLVVTRSVFEDAAPSTSDEVIHRAGVVTEAGDGAWVARGRPEGPQASLLQFRPRAVPRHAILIAEGELHTGGVSFGLLTTGHRPTSVSVIRPGPFVVALEAPADGNFEVAVANDIVPWWPASHIGRRVGPLVEWIPGATLRTDLLVKRIGWRIADSRRAALDNPEYPLPRRKASAGHDQD